MNIVGGTGLNKMLDVMPKAVDFHNLVISIMDFEWSVSEIPHEWVDSIYLDTVFYNVFDHDQLEIVKDTAIYKRSKRIKRKKKKK